MILATFKQFGPAADFALRELKAGRRVTSFKRSNGLWRVVVSV